MSVIILPQHYFYLIYSITAFDFYRFCLVLSSVNKVVLLISMFTLFIVEYWILRAQYSYRTTIFVHSCPRVMIEIGITRYYNRIVYNNCNDQWHVTMPSTNRFFCEEHHRLMLEIFSFLRFIEVSKMVPRVEAAQEMWSCGRKHSGHRGHCLLAVVDGVGYSLSMVAPWVLLRVSHVGPTC